jgi:hypothetical protein
MKYYEHIVEHSMTVNAMVDSLAYHDFLICLRTLGLILSMSQNTRAFGGQRLV